MTRAVYSVASVLVGCGAALQVALLGAVGRERGPMDATWVLLLATVTVLALLLALRATGGSGLAPPWPFDRPTVLVLTAIVSGALLGLDLHGLPPYFAATGALAVPFLLGAASLEARLGIGLFLGAVIAGQLGAGGVALLGGGVLVRGLRWG